MQRRFYAVLANSLAAFMTNIYVWFAVTVWVYLETQSVIATSVMAGIYSITVAVSGFFLGSLVDRYPKKRVMLFAGVWSLVLYALALTIYLSTPPATFANAASLQLWVFVALTLVGAIIGNVRAIALSTLVTIMVPEDGRDKANGLVGTSNGVAFLAASILSGLALLFTVAGLVGLLAAVLAMRSRAYRLLSSRFGLVEVTPQNQFAATSARRRDRAVLHPLASRADQEPVPSRRPARDFHSWFPNGGTGFDVAPFGRINGVDRRKIQECEPPGQGA